MKVKEKASYEPGYLPMFFECGLLKLDEARRERVRYKYDLSYIVAKEGVTCHTQNGIGRCLLNPHLSTCTYQEKMFTQTCTNICSLRFDTFLQTQPFLLVWELMGSTHSQTRLAPARDGLESEHQQVSSSPNFPPSLKQEAMSSRRTA